MFIYLFDGTKVSFINKKRKNQETHNPRKKERND